MEAVVPPEITTELTQILSNLVLGDNEIRASAEKAVNERLASTPEMYLLALAQFAISADTEVMRSFSLVLLRRLLFRPAPNSTHPTSSLPPSSSDSTPSNPLPAHQRTTLYDHLSRQTLGTLERLMLWGLAHEASGSVRKKTVDTVSDLCAQGMARGYGWHALQAQAFAMACAGIDGHPGAASIDASNPNTNGNGNGVGVGVGTGTVPPAPAVLQRESAFLIFAACPNLVMDLQTDAVLTVFQRGLKDPQSISVRHAALTASTAFLAACDPTGLAQSISLLAPMLDTLSSLAQSLSTHSHSLSSTTAPTADAAENDHDRRTSPTHWLSVFLSTITPLAGTHPILFAPHLGALLRFLPGLMLPAVDCGPTPTVGRPFPMGGGRAAGAGASANSNSSSAGGAFTFPPTASKPYDEGEEEGEGDEDDLATDHDDDDERSTLRLSALEFMITLSEARPNMVRKVPGWCEVVVRACLEGMGEVEEEEGWVGEDPSTSSSSADTDAPSALYEQSLDRLACAMGGKSILPPAFQYIPSMMVSFDWRVRHAGLMAIAAIGEGTGKVMQKELQTIVDMVTPMFNDAHPRVRYAACQCVGQLCTDLEEVIQQRFHRQLFAVLIPALEDPEPRVHAHAASALINFCEGVERDTLVPYLDPIVHCLLKLLNPQGEGAVVRRYVQEQAITTLAMVADASEKVFAKHYGTIMPLLLSVLQNAGGPDYRKLRVKAMECAGLIAIAVGPDVFRPDSTTLIEALVRIQQGPIDPNDTQLAHYLMATWAKICQAMGGEFEQYLPVVMPSILETARAQPDLSVYDHDEYEERDGWETILLDGRTYGVRTSTMDEKCQAFETLVIYCSTLGPKFAPYLGQTLEVTLPSLRFYFHEGVREACAMLVPMLLACGKESNTLTTHMVQTTFMEMINCISKEHDATFLASLYKYFSESVRVLGGVHMLPQELHDGVIEATKRQLHSLADRRKARAARVQLITATAGGTGSAAGDWDREDMVLLEEIEDFALEDMGKMLVGFDPNHPLLVAVAGVRDLGFNTYDSDDDGEDGEES